MSLFKLQAGGYEKLLALLDSDPMKADAEYQKLRGKLVTFFRCRGITDAEDKADEALLRTANKLATGLEVLEIQKYPYGIAKFILMESFKEKERHSVSFEESSINHTYRSSGNQEKDLLKKEITDCTRKCFNQLSPADRDFISSYGEKGEKSDAERKRKSRLVKKLWSCTEICAREIRS